MIITIFELILIGVINLSLFFISAVAKSECDTIKFNSKLAWYQTDFWLGKKDISKRSWWFKYPLSFMWDGWHLMDSTRNTCLVMIMLIPYAILFSIAWYWVLLFTVLWYMIYGIVFEIFYQN